MTAFNINYCTSSQSVILYFITMSRGLERPTRQDAYLGDMLIQCPILQLLCQCSVLQRRRILRRMMSSLWYRTKSIACTDVYSTVAIGKFAQPASYSPLVKQYCFTLHSMLRILRPALGPTSHPKGCDCVDICYITCWKLARLYTVLVCAQGMLTVSRQTKTVACWYSRPACMNL